MKRIATLLLAVVFTFGGVFGNTGAAQADGVSVTLRGAFDFAFGPVKNAGFTRSYNDSSHRIDRDDHYDDDGYRIAKGNRRSDDPFEARQRLRLQADFVASEYLSGVLQIEIGGLDWGRSAGGGTAHAGGSVGGALDADGVNIKTRRAYIDWLIPNTEMSVRMGLQGVYLPAGPMGNPVFGADVAGIVAHIPLTDSFCLTPFWLRPFDESNNATNHNGRKLRDETDVFGLVAPLEFSRGSFSPYVMYAQIGNASGFWEYVFDDGEPSRLPRSSTNAWWVGGNLKLDLLDPLELNLDAIYGRIKSTRHSLLDMHPETTHIDNPHRYGKIGAAGWYIGATLDYRLDWGTPGIFGWYASGDRRSADDGNGAIRIGRLPVLGTDNGFYPTSFGTVGYYGIGNGGNDGLTTDTGTGTWGIGIQLADMSFIEDLSHTLRFAYYRGTNSAGLARNSEAIMGERDGDLVEVHRVGSAFFQYAADPLYLTNKDSVFEINFDHVYSIYENLEVALELGWLQLRSDRNTWGDAPGLRARDSAWKAQINFLYSF